MSADTTAGIGKMSNIKITELMPTVGTWPDWTEEAAVEGQLFSECMKRIKALEEVHRILCGCDDYNLCNSVSDLLPEPPQ